MSELCCSENTTECAEQKNVIGWFELPVTNLERAEKFYTEYFGFEMTRMPDKADFSMSWFPMDNGYGAAGMLLKGEGYNPSHDGPILYFKSPEETVAEGVKKAEKLGIKVLVPTTDIGEHGFFAFIEDSEGNRIGIHSTKG